MIVLVLITLAVRANAKPVDDSIAMAIRYANILTGVDHQGDLDDLDDLDGLDDRDDRDDPDDLDDRDVGDEVSDVGEPRTAADHHGDAPTDGDHRDTWTAGHDHGEAIAGVDLGGAAIDDLLARLRHGGDEASEGDDGAAGDPGIPDSVASAATLDADPAPPGTTVGDDASVVTGSAGAFEAHESLPRQHRSSRWGRLDVGIEWRHRWRDALHALPYRFDEVWLVATWRR